MKKLIKQLEKQIRKEFGKKCKLFYWFCPVCLAWFHFEAIKQILEDDFNPKKH